MFTLYSANGKAEKEKIKEKGDCSARRRGKRGPRTSKVHPE